MDKVLLINKPSGMTSFDVVHKCKKIFHEKKVGHTGTLDPEAEGLLIVLMGKYTKFLPYAIKDKKRYIAEFTLGYKSDTEDIWGNLEEVNYHELYMDEVNKIIPKFTGEIEQIPPMYSAIKVNGKKLYEYAREGIEIEREARKVFINELEIEKIDERKYLLKATVSSGTYIRTLITDIAKALGESAVMSKLTRVAIEHCKIEDAIKLEDLNEDYLGINPLDIVSEEYERVIVEDIHQAIHGIPMVLEGHSAKIIIVKNDEAIAVYEKRGSKYYCVRGLM